MNIRKLLLPTLIAAALAAPSVFAQNADAKDQDHSQHQGQAATTSKTDKAKAEAKSDTRKDKEDAKAKAARKDAKSAAEQPDEPEEDGRR